MRGKSPAARNCRDSSALSALDADHYRGCAYKKASPKRSFLIDSTPLNWMFLSVAVPLAASAAAQIDRGCAWKSAGRRNDRAVSDAPDGHLPTSPPQHHQWGSKWWLTCYCGSFKSPLWICSLPRNWPAAPAGGGVNARIKWEGGTCRIRHIPMLEGYAGTGYPFPVIESPIQHSRRCLD